jgi:D-alanyl-D-alanine carboxypeptidase/D-alanyl-D-alanine-endopeptidase (penicillin-binding protein 4)
MLTGPSSLHFADTNGDAFDIIRFTMKKLALILTKLGAALSLSQLAVAAPVQQSVLITRVADGKVLYEKNPERLLIPASTTKIITAAAVLAKFTPARQFSTKFYYTGTRTGGIISGDLVIVGDGDPFVVSEKLWQLAADFRNMGIKEIRGGVMIDNSLFADNGRDESRTFGEKISDNAYDAPVSAFGVNFNTIAVSLSPQSQLGAKVYAGLDPYPLNGIQLNNSATTGKNDSIKLSRITRNGRESLEVTGKLAIDSELKKIYRSVTDYRKVSGEYVRAFLAADGIKVGSKVVEGKLPPDAKLLYDMPSYDLAKIVAGLNKFSNNYIADVMLKRLGAEFPRAGVANAPGQGSFENGLYALNRFMSDDVKITSKFVIKNGSGLNTDNRLSADQLVKVLLYAHRHLEFFPEFLASLPASGWDGTLKDRFQDQGALFAQGLVRAKTGTLTEPVTVVSLAGYMQHSKLGLLAFAMLENGVPGKAQPTVDELRRAQDKTLASYLQN